LRAACYLAIADEFDNNTRAFLVTDVAIACSTTDASSAAHEEVKVLAVVAIVIYPLGFLVLTAGLLFCASTAIRAGKHTALSEATMFLHGEYEVAYFWQASRRIESPCRLVGPLWQCSV
jgi:hypothetical protein